jgi:hypothetical protein
MLHLRLPVVLLIGLLAISLWKPLAGIAIEDPEEEESSSSSSSTSSVSSSDDDLSMEQRTTAELFTTTGEIFDQQDVRKITINYY